MFGIAIANAEQLSEDEKQRYRSFYCGVCHALKNRYGQLSRVALTYDLAFLAIVLGSLFEPDETVRTSRCIVHPTKDHTYIEGGFTDYAAAMTVALAFHKCLDDWVDDGSIPQVAYSVALRREYRRVRKEYPMQCAAIEENLKAISAIERDAMQRFREAKTEEEKREAFFDKADEAANRFGAIMAAVFLAQPIVWAEELTAFSMHFGRFIYFADAAFDREEDEKRGAYNPFVYVDLSDEEISELLFTIIGQAASAFEKLPLERDLHMMRSVVYSGVWQKLSAKQLEKEKKLAKQQQDQLKAQQSCDDNRRADQSAINKTE
ncbi:MAG: hypothetical protein IJJ32_05405 [Eggerthellaceae bacterium]|nr:hypothetical protein [Eggerthellaceae bacterium]